MTVKNEELESALVDIVTGRPYEFEIDGKPLRFYPVTLAKTFLLRRWLDALEMDTVLLKVNPYVECLRLAERQKDVVARILAIHSTPNTEKDFHDTLSRSERRRLLEKLKPSHLSSLLMTVLTADKTDELADYLGITAERKHLDAAMAVKRENGNNTLTFGGVSVFGSFIGPLQEMGYNDIEILFERSYSYLRLRLADRVTSLYMSDEELESLNVDSGGRLLDGEDDADLEKLATMIKNR